MLKFPHIFPHFFLLLPIFLTIFLTFTFLTFSLHFSSHLPCEESGQFPALMWGNFCEEKVWKMWGNRVENVRKFPHFFLTLNFHSARATSKSDIVASTQALAPGSYGLEVGSWRRRRQMMCVKRHCHLQYQSLIVASCTRHLKTSAECRNAVCSNPVKRFRVLKESLLRWVVGWRSLQVMQQINRAADSTVRK